MDTIIPDLLLYSVKENRCSADYATRLIMSRGRIVNYGEQRSWVIRLFAAFLGGDVTLEDAVSGLINYGEKFGVNIKQLEFDGGVTIHYESDSPWLVKIEETENDNG